MTAAGDRKALAIDCVLRQGQSYRDVARAAGVTATTVMRWVRAAQGATPPPQLAPPPPDEPPALDDNDTLATTRRMLADTLRLAKQARLDGNYATAQRSMRDAGALTNTIARLEKATAADADVLRLSRAEVDEAMAGVQARVTALLSRPLLCAECGRALSVKWGEGGE